MITLYTAANCTACEEAKALCRAAGIIAYEQRLLAVHDLPDRDDAMAQLADQNMAAPLVRIGNTWTDLQGLRTWLESQGE